MQELPKSSFFMNQKNKPKTPNQETPAYVIIGKVYDLYFFQSQGIETVGNAMVKNYKKVRQLTE